MLVASIIEELERLDESIQNLKGLVEDQVRDDELDEAEKNLFKLRNKVKERNLLKNSRVEFVEAKRNIRE